MTTIIGIASNMAPDPIDAIKRSPVIYTPTAYISGIHLAGGLPIVLPLSSQLSSIPTYISQIDGLLLAGGQDISPALYGEDALPQLQKTLPERDAFEQALIQEAIKQQKPILGICRGMQMLNVTNGGTLYQDIPSQANPTLPHIQEDAPQFPAHAIQTTPNSLAQQIFGNESAVNTLHHQAVKDLAPNFTATAFSPDGFIEAIESNEGENSMFGVQWHPELMLTQHHAQSLELFKTFVTICETQKQTKL